MAADAEMFEANCFFLQVIVTLVIFSSPPKALMLDYP